MFAWLSCQLSVHAKVSAAPHKVPLGACYQAASTHNRTRRVRSSSPGAMLHRLEPDERLQTALAADGTHMWN